MGRVPALRTSPGWSPSPAAQYAAIATSNATGGLTDANRYITPTLTSGNESTHLFRFVLSQPAAEIDEIRVVWEGFADRCTQVELYVWNNARSQWGDAGGLVGQNRFLDNYAGNRDRTLEARLRSNLSDLIAADGSIRFLVYGERGSDETVHDYMALTVLRAAEDAPCEGDIDLDNSVDGKDLAILLSTWGPCSGCAADFDGDSEVDGQDLSVLLTRWGPCP